MIILKGITITCNYPDDECEANVPKEMSLDELYLKLSKLMHSEPEMTSFVIVASVAGRT